MKQGDNYTLTVGDQSSTFTLDDITYSEGSGGMQRPGGNLDKWRNTENRAATQMMEICRDWMVIQIMGRMTAQMAVHRTKTIVRAQTA